MILGLARFAQFYTLINTVFSHSEHIIKLTEEWLWQSGFQCRGGGSGLGGSGKNLLQPHIATLVLRKNGAVTDVIEFIFSTVQLLIHTKIVSIQSKNEKDPVLLKSATEKLNSTEL